MNKYLLPSNYWRFIQHTYFPTCKKSYSDRGEDLIISAFFKKVGIVKPAYIDVGTHHPIYANNTYYFYKRGSAGACIEPNPDMHRKIQSKRRRDICLNVGVSNEEHVALSYYVLSATTRNTFNKNEADRLVQSGFCTLTKQIKIPVTTLERIIEENFANTCPDFISIDTEGYDLRVIQSIDLAKHRPALFCIETLAYHPDGREYKSGEVTEYLKEKNYLVYADTHVNTIFVDSGLYSAGR